MLLIASQMCAKMEQLCSLTQIYVELILLARRQISFLISELQNEIALDLQHINTAFIDIRTKRLSTFRVDYLPRLSTLRFFNKCNVPFF
jgi:hypothetical protein